MKFLDNLLSGFINKNNIKSSVEVNKTIEQNANDINGLIVYAPKNIAELNKVIDCIARGQTIIINMGNIKSAEYNKVADYLCGALYALNAEINCLQNSLYIITPKNVKISTIK
ncbi:MAG: cell division protein SepF [Christensenellales bacterium]